MKLRFRALRWFSSGTLMLTLGLGAAATSAHAQYAQPSPALASVQRHWTNKTSFQLPIEIAPKDRASVKEVILYVKESDGQWAPKDKAPPTQPYFNYHVSKEGEYWFSVVTVDLQNRMNPTDVTREPPMLIVLVDFTPPVVDILPTALANGQAGLRCVVKDANPDYQKLQLAYQTPGKTWQPLEPVPGMAGVYQLPPGSGPTAVVRYTIEDKAKNKNSQDVVIQLPGGGASAMPPTVTPNGSTPGMPSPLPKTSALPLNPEPTPVPPSPLPPIDKHVSDGSSAVPVSTAYSQQYAPGQPTEPGYKAVPPIHGSDYAPKTNDYGAPGKLGNGSPPPVHKAVNSGGMQSRQVINTATASIDYRLDKVGPSGVAKIEVWAKGENATGWQRLASDLHPKSSVKVQLPHEGLYGIRLAVTNGNGFGGAPPQPNDQPSFWIEVDTTPPFAQLHPISALTGGDSIDIRWTATDKNLGSEPVNLYWSTQRNGPWQPIARNLPNSGQYNWHFPRDIATQFFVRLEVTDEAGNVTRSELNSPVQLDLSEPQAEVVGVSGVVGN